MLGKFMISEKIYLPVIYIIGSFIIYFVMCKIVDKVLVFNKMNKKKSVVQQKRETTIVNLIKSVIKYIIAVFALLSILNVFGIETTSIIASLGIAGAIIGLAFQDTLKNLLSGISIIFDNHYMQGDIVTINNFKGEVIELGLQTTKIKAYSGEVMIINNSLITSVINHSMFNTKLILDLPISKKLPISDLENLLNNVSNRIKKLKEVNEVVLLGVEKLNSNNYIYKIEIDCLANNQYSVNRKFMAYLKEEYENNKIEVPSELLEVKK